MALSNKVIVILGIYFDVVDKTQIGTRLFQIWDALSVQQKDAVQALMKDSYFVMFDFITVQENTEETIQLLSDCAEVLTSPQRIQLFNLIKADIVAVYDLEKDDIDTKIADVNGTTVG